MSLSFVLFTDPDTGRESLIDSDGMLLVNVHPSDQCAGQTCVVHNPSNHHMRSWPMKWAQDTKLFERVCPHGFAHTDPDQLEYLAARKLASVHVCDGCCVIE